MKKTVKSITAIILSILMLVSCASNNETQNTGADMVEIDLNETQTLYIGTQNIAENINPFYVNDNNREIVDLMNARLITTDENGMIAYGDNYPTVAHSYTVNFVNEQNEVHSEFSEGDRALYTFIIKKNLRFSNGETLTIDDVMFTLYTALDPLYNGTLEIKNLSIEGLSDYQKQMSEEVEQEYTELGETFLENGNDFEYEDENEKKLSEAFWGEILSLAGENYCAGAVKYVTDNFLTDEYVKRYISDELTAKDVSGNESLKIAYAMIVWEVGSFSENGKFKLSNREVDLKNGETLTLADFWNEIYLKTDGDLEKIDADAVGENTVKNVIVRLFTEKYGPLAMSEKITSISGISKGELLIDGEVYSTLSIMLSEYSPSDLSQMMIPIVSKTAYTAGVKTNSNVANYGAPLNSTEFMSHIKSIKQPKIASGAYKAAVGPLGAFYEDGVCYFERNEYFKSFGVHNAYVKNLAFVSTEQGKEFSDLEGDFFTAATFIPDFDSAEKLSDNKDLDTVREFSNSYGYILINPHHYPDLNERIAIASLFDSSLAINYYPKNTASSIYRSQSKASFVYPDFAKKVYPFEKDDEALKALFEKAGYEFKEEEDGKKTMLDSSGEQANFVFTLPKERDSHPAGEIFKKAVERITSLGGSAEIAVDETLTDTVKTDTGVGIYALGRLLSTDPDSRHFYDCTYVSDTTKANGISWLYENGEDDDLGEIEWEEETLTQAKALEKLSEILSEAAQQPDYSKRGELYSQSLEILSLLSIEIPIYQRNSLFVYDKNTLDLSEIGDETSSFSTVYSNLYKVKFK